MEKAFKVIVLGGTGIIGRELTHQLVDAGSTVYVVSRGTKSVAQGAIPIVCDVYDYSNLKQKIEDISFDAVIDLVSFNTSQLKELVRVFEGRAHQYMFVSSATVYDGTQQGKITEDSPLISEGWEYPMSKIACERYIRGIAADSNQVYTIVRPYITYSEQRLSFGVWEAPDIWHRLQEGAPVTIGDDVAKTKTTLTHTSDLAAGMKALIGNEGAYNEDFHITSDEVVTWMDVYTVAASATDKHINLVESSSDDLKSAFPELRGKINDRLKRRVFDNSKLYRVCPELKMRYSLAHGYEETIEKGLSASNGIAGLILQGRIDRFLRIHAKDALVKKQATLYRKQFSVRLPLKERLAYSVGYLCPWLVNLLRRVRRLV